MSSSMQLRAHWAWRLLYNHNPFYLISACLVLFGLHLSFGAADSTGRVSWLLMAGLAGYTTLVAVAGCLIVRFGQVWDDARTILLVLVLLCLALSASFDRLLNVNLQSGQWILALGFAFSLIISEAVLRALRIRLPAPWRIPYYLILGLLFAYPVYVAQAVDVATVRAPIAWRVLLFSPISGLVLLTLLPAARRGRDEPRHNGTPWPWPLFPWSLFVMLFVGIALRMYFLSLSFDPIVGDESMLQAYFLIPPLLALAVVVLELCLVAGWRHAASWCLGLPILLPLLAIGRLDPTADGALYLELLLEHAGSPLFLTLWTLVVYYALAWLRGLPNAFNFLRMVLASLLLVGPSTVDLYHLSAWQWPPLAVLCGCHLLLALRWQRTWHWLVSALLGVALVSVLGRGTWITAHSGFFAWHLAIAALLMVGAVRSDATAWLARASGGIGLLVGAWLALAESPDSLIFVHDWRILIYELALIGGAVAYAYFTSSTLLLASAVTMLASCLAVFAWQILHLLKRQPLGEGVGLLAAGGICLAVAAAISLAKAGYLRRFGERVSAAAAWSARDATDS